MKRFYRVVTSQKAVAGWEIHLDGKPVRTPGGSVLTAPDSALSDMIVGEWAAQETDIIPDSMPVTQIMVTARDRVADHRDVMTRDVMAYLDTDLLCYRTDASEEVGVKQAQAWDPWIKWFSEFYGPVLQTTTDLAAITQDKAAHSAALSDVQAVDDVTFTILQMVTALAGSLVLALAFVHAAADAEDILTAMHVEEDHKSGIYNEALHGLAPQEEKRRIAARRDLEAAARMLSAIRKRA